MLALGAVLVGLGAAAWWWATSRPAASARAAASTLLDVADAAGAEALVRALARGDGADALADRLLALWTAFPPDEPRMRALALAQAAHAGEGGARDYCATLVFALASEALGRPRARPAARRRGGSARPSKKIRPVRLQPSSRSR